MLNASLKLEFFGLSDIGLVRDHNEDAWVAHPDKGIFILADGMGGHNAGEIAAQVSVSTLFDVFSTSSLNMKSAFEKVNSLIYQMGEESPSLSGMGTTLICLEVLEEKKCVVTHVGDSRLYLFRDGSLKGVTKDHSLVNELLSLGTISEEEVEIFPYKHVLTKAVGTNPTITPESQSLSYLDGDVFLLCTDGLTNYATEKEIESALRQMESLEEGAKLLVESAKKNGGGDNITVLLVKIHDLSR